MNKRELARRLRQRQYDHGEVSRSLIDALSDDEIIDSYVTCSCCGEKQVEGPRLALAIAAAADDDDFFELCSRLAAHRPHRES
jgi:hypothetical protein